MEPNVPHYYMKYYTCDHCGRTPEDNIFLNWNVQRKAYICTECAPMILNCAGCNSNWWSTREALTGPPYYCGKCTNNRVSIGRLIKLEASNLDLSRTQLEKAKYYLTNIVQDKSDMPHKLFKAIADANNLMIVDIVQIFARRYDWHKAVQRIIWYNNHIGLDAYDCRLADQFHDMNGEHPKKYFQQLLDSRPLSICLSSDDPSDGKTPF